MDTSLAGKYWTSGFYISRFIDTHHFKLYVRIKAMDINATFIPFSVVISHVIMENTKPRERHRNIKLGYKPHPQPNCIDV